MRHGTRTAYNTGCHCSDCQRAHREYEQNRRRQVLYGRWDPFTDPQPVREHVTALRASGIGLRRIADLAQVSRSTLWKLIYGADGHPPTQRIRHDTARRIMDIESLPAPSALVPARPTWRLIEGMIALGYTKAWVAQEAGLGKSLQLRHDRILQRSAEAIHALAQRVGDDPGPSDKARRYAADRGWLVPAYGSDEDIAALGRIAAEIRREQRVEHAEQVEALTFYGLSAREIATRLGTNSRRVQRDRARNLTKKAAGSERTAAAREQVAS